MKKVVLALIVAAVVAVGVISFLLFGKKDNLNNATDYKGGSSATIPTATSFKKACDVLTQADSEAVLGTGATKTESSGSSDVVTAERSVTTCGYKIGSATDIKQATVLLRASSPSEAKSGFNRDKQIDATDVSDLGEGAYWSPTYGRLNVIQGGTWMIISVGGPRISEHTQPDAQKLAYRLVSKL